MSLVKAPGTIVFSLSIITIIFTLSLNSISVYGVNTENYSLIKEWGTTGTADGQFNKPVDIAISDPSNHVYVVDSGNNRIQVFDTNGKLISKWGSKGTGDGQFDNPTGISIDPVGNIYVIDSGNSRIQKFSSDGLFLTKWDISDVGAGPVYLSGISIDAAGNVYYVQPQENRIQITTTDGNTMDTYYPDVSAYGVGSFGSNGLGNGQFSTPTSIVVDSSNNNIYVLDTNNHRIQKFGFTSVDGIVTGIKFIAKWGTQGADEGQFSREGGIAIDSVGNIYLADTNNHRIQKFDSNGNFVTQWGTQGADEGQFNAPYGLDVDKSGNVYVSDLKNNEIQVFAKTS
jgi:DNA-binding beta-propeller fold protein YncE